MSFCVVPRSWSRLHALVLGVGHVQAEQPGGRGVDGHRRVHLARGDAVEQLAHVARGARPARRPCPPRPGPAGRRGRSRSGWAGRRRSTDRSGPWPGWCGTARWRPWPSSAPSRCASARAGRARGGSDPSRVAGVPCADGPTRVRGLSPRRPPGANANGRRAADGRRPAAPGRRSRPPRSRPARPGAASTTARRAARRPPLDQPLPPVPPARPSRRRGRGGTSTHRRTGRRCATP